MLPTKIIRVAVGGLLVLGIGHSCQDNRLGYDPEPEQTVAFTATIDSVEYGVGVATTVAFNRGDVVAISGGGAFIDYIYQDHTWGAVGAEQLDWSAPTMTFSAYYPVGAGAAMNRFVLPQNQNSTQWLARANYMRAEATPAVNDGSVVGLKFRHQLSQVVLRVECKSAISEDTPVIRRVEIVSPHAQMTPLGGMGEPVAVAPLRAAAKQTYHAVLIPGTMDREQVFVRVVMEDGGEYVLKGAPKMAGNRCYELVVSVGAEAPELELVSVTVGAWLDEQIVDVLRRYAFTLNDKTVYYPAGEVLDLHADFIAGHKFTGWSTEPAVLFENKAVTQLSMPANDLTVKAKYAEAPYKLVVRKPGLSVDSRGGRGQCSALVEQTQNEYIRYYAAGDEVDIYDPTPSFVRWGSSGAWADQVEAAIAVGGGDHASSWFLMPQADVEVFPVYDTDEGKELLLHVAQRDYNTTNSGKILSDSEPKSAYYDPAQRKFDVKAPLQCGFDDDGKLHIRFYSAVGISNVKILWNKNGQQVEFARFDHIPPFFEARFEHPISQSGGTLVATDGSLVSCDRMFDLQQAEMKLSVSCDDAYWQKIRTIIPSVVLHFDAHGGDPDAPDGKPVQTTSWMGIRPVHIREACAMVTNMAYMISTERFKQLIDDHIDELWGNAGQGHSIDAGQLLQKYRAHYTLSIGLVWTGRGVYGWGSPNTLGVAQGQFFSHYVYTKFAWHEYGHVLGYQHSSSMTHGAFSETHCSEMYTEMVNSGEMPVSDRTALQSLQNPTRYGAE